MKKLLSILFCVLFVCAIAVTAYAANNDTEICVTANKTEVKPGDSVLITVSVSGTDPFTSMGYMPQRNSPYFTISNYTFGEALEANGSANIKTFSQSYGLAVGGFEDNETYANIAVTMNGVILTFWINIKEDAPLGQFDVTEMVSFKNHTTQLAYTLKDCTITVVADCQHAYQAQNTGDSSLHTLICTQCGNTKTESHSWNAGEITKQPTYSQQGEKTFTCTQCGATKIQYLPKLEITDSGDTKLTVSVDKTVVNPGDTVNVTVSVTGTDPFTSMGYIPDHDGNYFTVGKYTINRTVLTDPGDPLFLNFTKTSGFVVGSYRDYETQEYIDVTLNGVILTFTIQIKEDAPLGQFKITADNAVNFKNGAEQLQFEVIEPILEVVCKHTYGAWIEAAEGHVQVCSKCGRENTAAHTWDNGVITTVPTCNDEGVKTFTCTACAATKTEAVPATGEHNFVNPVKVDATNHKVTCGCGTEKLVAHTWDNGVITKQPTYSQQGEKTFTCTQCGATKIQYLPKLEITDSGDTKLTVSVDKTLVKPGDTVNVTVSVTGTSPFTSMGFTTNHNGEYFTIGQHTLNDAVLSAPGDPAYTNFSKVGGFALGGYYDYDTAEDISVTLDGVIITFTIHIRETAPRGQFTIINKVNFKNGATQLDFAIEEPTLEIACEHTYGAWTEAAEGHVQVCSKCGKENTEAHTWNAGEVTTAPTCKDIGLKTFTCTACAATKTEEVAKTEYHTFGAWVANGDKHEKTCSVCEKVESASHTWNAGTVTTPPTCQEDGVRTFTCTICATTKTEVIPTSGEHNFVNPVKVNDTQHKLTCSCGEEKVVAHTWDAGKVTMESTYFQKGVKTFTCQCGATKTQSLPKLESYSNTKLTVAVDKTLVKPGDTVNVTVSVTGTDPFTSMGFTTNHDGEHFTIGKYTVNREVLTAPGSPALISFGKTSGFAVGGYADYDTEEDIAVTLDGVILTFAITIKDDAPVGQFKITKSANFKNFAAQLEFDVLEPILTVSYCEHTYEAGSQVDATYHEQYCPLCGNTQFAAHTWDAGKVTTEPGCVTDGVKAFTCTACSATKTETVAATGNHTWDAGSVTRKPTCTVDGVKTFTCTACSATKTETIAALGYHTWDAGSVTRKPTCTVDGVKTFTCTACSATKTETIAALGYHVWNAGVVTLEPTCTLTGVKTFTCTNCDVTYTETIPATGIHSFDNMTQFDDNNHKLFCACGSSITLPHTWNAGEITTEPTCAQTGIKTFTCVCGTEKTEVLPLTDIHSFTDWTVSDSTAHTRNCAVCGKLETENHSISNGKCTVCNWKVPYVIIFQDENGTELSKETYYYGDTVKVPADPTKAADTTYTYTFAGWDQTVTEVTGNVTYTATYTAAYIEYTVKFVYDDGSVYIEATYHYGDEVKVPADPEKAPTANGKYTFIGWDKEISSVTEDAIYTAQFSFEQTLPDFNHDGKITDADAIYLLRHTLFPEDYPLDGNGDINCDGKVTDADAIYLLRYTLFPEDYPLFPKKEED